MGVLNIKEHESKQESPSSEHCLINGEGWATVKQRTICALPFEVGEFGNTMFPVA
jgi:hypothetical protein